MAFVQFTRVSLAFGDRDIIKNAALNLSTGCRSALTGANGSGKSTLMKIIAGKVKADSGERAVEKGTRVSYLPQAGDIAQGLVRKDRTLREEAETAYADALAMLERMEALGSELEKSSRDDKRTAALLEEYHLLEEGLEARAYYSREQEINRVLTGLGFSGADLSRLTGEFSGGWQMRIALAKVLLENPGILLLDEPTNYLDIEARSWLEAWLKDFQGGCLLVSHDRYFLDTTVNEVYELFQGELRRYAGNYSNYEKIREEELKTLTARYKAQEEEIARAEDLIRRFRYKATKAAMVQERIKRLEKMERIEIPESLKKIKITFPPPPHSGRIALTLEGVEKSYGERRVIQNLGLLVESGEKLLVVGRNGAGKSTLLRLIAGEDRDYTGEISYGSGISAGYFSQESAENMTSQAQVLEFLEAASPTALVPRVRDMLGAFLFRGDDVYKPVSVLSGGEKSRLALLLLLLKPKNLLILDEPTNHLDLSSKDILLETLREFQGTLIFVSHDRSFMEALSTKTLELSGAPSRLFYGGYSYYLDRLEREAGGNVQERPDTAPQASAPQAAPLRAADKGGTESAPYTGSPAAGNSAAEYREAEKQRQAWKRRARRREEELLLEVEELEAKKAGLEAALARPDVYTSGEKARLVKLDLDTLSGEIEKKTLEWEEAARHAAHDTAQNAAQNAAE